MPFRQRLAPPRLRLGERLARGDQARMQIGWLAPPSDRMPEYRDADMSASRSFTALQNHDPRCSITWVVSDGMPATQTTGGNWPGGCQK